MATQYTNQSTSNVTIEGQLLNFQSNTVLSELFTDASVTLVKSQSADLVVSGGSITYTIVISNLSLTSLNDFNLLDTIPTGMTYTADSFKVNATAQTPTINNQDLSYNFETLPVGVTTVTFDCTID
ncbi:hypothetical protein D3C72_1451900 [compost metagenome]